MRFKCLGLNGVAQFGGKQEVVEKRSFTGDLGFLQKGFGVPLGRPKAGFELI